MMNGMWLRLRALILNEIYVTRHRLEIGVDTLFFPLMNVVLFGYITAYVSRGSGVNGTYFIAGVLLWEIMLVMQYNTTVSTMWSIWSHNLTNIFIAPISISEYLVGQAIAAALRTALVMAVLNIGSAIVFHFSLLDLGVANLALFSLNLMLFAFSLGVVFLGIIFRFGVRLQAVSWGAIYLFQPLVGAFFPISVLPGFLQFIAHLLPGTYVFTAARAALTSTAVNWRYALLALGLNVVYLVLSILIFRVLFRRSKETGQFARNDL